MSLFRSIFIWWQDRTIGTAWYTARKGVRVGTDDQGNVYYHERKGHRRWVIYNGDVEASRVPPEWHRWLHYTADAPPTEEPLVVKPWEKEHLANRTGTQAAYFPPGSLSEGGQRKQNSADYEAWIPE